MIHFRHVTKRRTACGLDPQYVWVSGPAIDGDSAYGPAAYVGKRRVAPLLHTSNRYLVTCKRCLTCRDGE